MPQYTKHPALSERDLAKDPLVQLARWLKDAQDAGLFEPTAMTLATADAQGRPSARMVLFKGLHDGGLTFYTNYASRKGAELAKNPYAALVFWWDKLERSVRIEGKVEKLPRTMGEQYFHSRPLISQVASYTSRQSQPVASREELDARFRENEKRFLKKEVPLPETWGGYLLRPETIEFWQGQPGRLHDRIVYRYGAGAWTKERLEP